MACVAASAVDPSVTSMRSTHALRSGSVAWLQFGLRTKVMDLPGW
jgi:hypothetical protein